jgi:type VI secretion system protein VasD
MMIQHSSRLDLLFALIVVMAASGCGKAPPLSVPTPPTMPTLPPITIAAPPDAKIKAAMTLAASADTNPDASGRPSPIVVRVYQLKTDAAFKGATFFDLYDDDQKVLGVELISRDEYVLAPSERKSIDVVVSGDTRFIGALAAFRDRNAESRTLVPAPRGGLNVTIERARVVLSAIEK